MSQFYTSADHFTIIPAVMLALFGCAILLFDFLIPPDPRQRKWLLIFVAAAEVLAGYELYLQQAYLAANGLSELTGFQGSVTVDGFAIGNVQEVVIRDRQMLAEDGMFVIVASINTSTGKLRKSPDIISRGFVYLRESQELLQQARIIIKKTVEEATAGMNPINFEYVKSVLTDNLSRFLFQKTAKRPIVIPVLIGV